MTLLDKILFGILLLLSFSTAITKLIQLPEEMELFRYAGFTDTMTIIFGVVQLIGAALLIPPKYRKQGALIMMITFIIASVVVFMKGMMGFGVFSLLFIALAAYQWKK